MSIPPLSRLSVFSREAASGRHRPRSLPFLVAWLAFVLAGVLPRVHAADPREVEVKDASIEGRLDGDTARLVIQANLGGLISTREPGVYGATVQHTLRITPDRVAHTFGVKVDPIRGSLREIAFPLSGEGEVREVTGEGLDSWSVRQTAEGKRSLVLRLTTTHPPAASFQGRIFAETPLAGVPAALSVLALTTEQPALGNGYVLIESPVELAARLERATGLVAIEPEDLPEEMAGNLDNGHVMRQAYRFHGTGYALSLEIRLADPESRQVVLTDFILSGEIYNVPKVPVVPEVPEVTAVFKLTALARVKNPKGGRLELLRGGAALVESALGPGALLRFDKGAFVVEFERAGEFPLEIVFHAAIRSTAGWNEVEFEVAPGALSPVTLKGLDAETQLVFTEGARPRRSGDAFHGFLPASGRVKFAWRPARPESEGRLFYAAEAVTQIAVSPGLLRQSTLLDLKLMQGELTRVTLRLEGEGEVTRVQGPDVLSWTLEAMEGSTDRRLIVQFNQPRHDRVSLQVYLQRPLGAFPLAIVAARLHPEGATRFAGYLRVVNEGAVRLEVLEAAGLSQISPDQFVESDATRALLPAQATQVFAYRFAGATHQLRVQADNILPELSVSQVLVYRLGETERVIDAELEVDVREAPLRELTLSVPKGYGLARLQASDLSDYFLTEPAEASRARLRLVYAAPVSGRQVVVVRLERNQALADTRWILPGIDVETARSVRGHVGVLADPGFRLTPASLRGLTEVAPAFFPKKLPGLQAAYRLVEAGWEAVLNIERLAQTIQVDAFHLFTVGEGIAYGSSLLNYGVSGAPVGVLPVELSNEYFNVEFTGKNIRNWQRTARGFEVHLHTPVTGSYALLATYERPFRARGETLTFTGARPLDVQSEQGYTLVVSTYPFQVQPANVSASLLPLETGEVPAEYRLFFDAPILAAYRYTARPFNLQLALNPLTLGEGVSQVIDRAALTTRISEEGQVVTDARYFVKNKGAPHLRLRMPSGAELWSVSVDGLAVVPVQDGQEHLIALPHHADPDVVAELQVKTASRASQARRLVVTAPTVGAPVLLAEWRLEPAEGRRLVYRGGTLTPAEGVVDSSGFAGLARLFGPENRARAWVGFSVAAAALAIAAWIWNASARAGGRRFGVRHWVAGLLGGVAVVVAVTSLLPLLNLADAAAADPGPGLRFMAPVQHANVAWTVRVENVSSDGVRVPWGSLMIGLIALVVGLYSLLTATRWSRAGWKAVAWTLGFWAVLRLDDHGRAFLVLLLVFVVLRVVLPALRRWWQAAGQPDSVPMPAAAVGILLLLGANLGMAPSIRAELRLVPGTESWADEVVHEIREQEGFIQGTAMVRWTAREGAILPLVYEPGVLTQSGHPTSASRLVSVTREGRRQQVLVSATNGWMEFTIHYEARVIDRGPERGFVLPVQAGLVHRARLTLTGLDVEVTSPAAVSVLRSEEPSTNTVVSLVLAPAVDTWVGWKPRSRDTRRERAVYFAEWTQLYVPVPGVIEGHHDVQIRPAQGELSEVAIRVPPGITITDVAAPALTFWRFDPDAGRLTVNLNPAQSKSFAVTIHSQISVGPLPFEGAAGLLRAEGAAGQVGRVGIATGTEVQLDSVEAGDLSAINLEDFPILAPILARTPELRVRRAFRYTAGDAAITLRASAVEPDVRVDAEQTLSLEEDRSLLAAKLDVEVIRAGIFKLSFALPPGFEVETITGGALSHWTELRLETNQTVTLHLKGKTLGREQFAITLAGPGVRSTNDWVVPRLALREAAKQRGQLLVVPEQGLRVQVARREGATQLDPAQAGVRQKGVLAFRLLQDPWLLTLDLEQIDAWIQVTSLQHVQIAEAQIKVSANLQYEIENTGVKALVLRLPASADNVRFLGGTIADSFPVATNAGVASKDWEVKLERRVLGRYPLQVTYTLPLADQATNAVIDGVEARDVHLQRGFVTLQAEGRLQVTARPPPALQATEWQAIPRDLLQEIAAPAASYTFRLVEPSFQLPVQFDRHEVARLLPARVLEVTLNSVVADDGAMLTQVRLKIVPGDKRLLHLTLPAQSRFWFAFVNQHSVWPWQATNQWLLPLEKSARAGEAAMVEFYYSSAVGDGGRSLDLELLGPRFELPLENIVWNVFLNEKWRLRDWSGTLRLRDGEEPVRAQALDLDHYIRNEVHIRQEKTREAEQILSLANTLLEKGDPQEARRAFQAAYGMSQHDQAFNEDARVQLNNLRIQQAMVGLNVRQARVGGGDDDLAAAPRELRENRAANYTQAEAKQLLDRNTAEESAVQGRLAERLIQQQDAAVASPAAIRAALPEQGRRLTFTRSLEVNTWSELRIGLEATSAGAVPVWTRLGVLLVAFVLVLVALAVTTRRNPAAP